MNLIPVYSLLNREFVWSDEILVWPKIAPEPGAGQMPVGVQSADQPYSSWGNEALWQ